MSTIEFFRPESQRPLDADGYELPPWLNPFLCDYIPDLVEPAADPTEADSTWLAQHPALPPICGGSLAEDDPAGYDEWSRRLEEMHQASERQDRLEGIYGPRGITDSDLAAAGLPIG